MTTFLIRLAIYLGSAAAGLIVADLLVDGFRISWLDWWGFVLAIVVFAVVQSLITPLATKLATDRAPLLLGGIGIIATFVSLTLVAILPWTGVRISSFAAWILAPLVVWLVSALATWLLTVFLVDRRAKARTAAARR